MIRLSREARWLRSGQPKRLNRCMSSASLARLSGKSCALPTSPTNASTSTARGNWRRIRTQKPLLQAVCSDVIRCFRTLTIYLAPVLPATAERVARELFGMDRPFNWSDLLAPVDRIAPYKHLMTRVEAKQIDALFEPPVEEQASTPLARWRRDRGYDLDRRFH